MLEYPAGLQHLLTRCLCSDACNAPIKRVHDSFNGTDVCDRCTMAELPGGEARVVLDGNDQGLAAGQYACFYQDNVCIGSAVILQGISVDDGVL